MPNRTTTIPACRKVSAPAHHDPNHLSQASSGYWARLDKGYTQQSLSEKADIGEVYLSEIERGLKMPSMNLFIKLITALDISADYILRDEVPTGKDFVYDELTQKLDSLTPKQRKTAADILDAYIRNL